MQIGVRKSCEVRGAAIIDCFGHAQDLLQLLNAVEGRVLGTPTKIGRTVLGIFGAVGPDEIVRIAEIDNAIRE
jgi:hypothetical protein